MTTLSALTAPLDSLNASRAYDAQDAIPNSAQLKTTEDTDKVAKKFEALLIHNMLKAMRTTTLGEEPSNARAMYNDMYDQHLSKVLSESGGLGIASSISRQLNAQQGIKDEQTQTTLNNIEKSMLALSNHPNTLERNGRIDPTLQPIKQYQALLNSNQSDVHAQKIIAGSNASEMLKPSGMSDTTPLGQTKKDFVDSLLPDAKRNAARLGIQPDIIIAIAALETGWGKYVIKEPNGASSNNLFGIKAHGKTSPYTMHKTTEFINNNPVIVDEPFRKFDSTASAVNGFADFLLNNPRYEKALNSNTDNTMFLRELHRAGYATDPEYANKAIDVLKQVQTLRQSTAL